MGGKRPCPVIVTPGMMYEVLIHIPHVTFLVFVVVLRVDHLAGLRAAVIFQTEKN